MVRKRSALCSVSLLSLLVAGPALAQTSPDATAAQSTPAEGTVDDSSTTPDIVVTGVRASIVGALNVRKNSTQIIDSVVAMIMRKANGSISA